MFQGHVSCMAFTGLRADRGVFGMIRTQPAIHQAVWLFARSWARRSLWLYQGCGSVFFKSVSMFRMNRMFDSPFSLPVRDDCIARRLMAKPLSRYSMWCQYPAGMKSVSPCPSTTSYPFNSGCLRRCRRNALYERQSTWEDPPCVIELTSVTHFFVLRHHQRDGFSS